MDRRAFLKTAALTAAAASLGRLPHVWAATEANQWRAFEVTTLVEILSPTGVIRAWVPLPLSPDTDYHKTLGRTWYGNADVARAARDPRYGAAFVAAEWAPGTAAPVLEVVSRVVTRDRQVDLSGPGTGGAEDPVTLRRYLEGSDLIRTDGIVEATAREITAGTKTDLERAGALYEWIVDNTFHDPQVRGDGLGDIQTMLETKSLGGKSADLNALFVGFARSIGIPARAVYGIRIADSAEFKSLGQSGDITKAQHCRAEFYLAGHGWVPVDPADVRKIVLEEKPGGVPLGDPEVVTARGKLFGAWEMNWMAYNYGQDVRLPDSAGASVPFLMYPTAEVADLRRDPLEPERFRYTIKSREIIF